MGGEFHRMPVPRDPWAPSPERWARRLQQGEPRAVEEVRNRIRKILKYRGLEIPVEERDDLEQEVMTEIWQAVNRSRFDFSGGFWGFVEVVTSRRCIDWLRTIRDQPSLPEDAVSSERGPLRKTLERERLTLAWKILSELELPCQELITSRLRDDLSYREIAQATGKSEGALRVQLYRCIQQARRAWGRLANDGGRRREEDDRR